MFNFFRKSEKSNVFVVLILLLLLVVAGYFTYKTISNPKDARDAVANIALSSEFGNTFENLQGESMSLDSYQGKVRVVNTWASWSPFSKDELPLLNSVAGDYNSEEVVFIAVNRMEQKERANAFLNKIDELSNLTVVIDPNDSFYKNVEGYAVPETIFFSEDGRIVKHKRGVINEEELRSFTEEALQYRD